MQESWEAYRERSHPVDFRSAQTSSMWTPSGLYSTLILIIVSHLFSSGYADSYIPSVCFVVGDETLGHFNYTCDVNPLNEKQIFAELNGPMIRKVQMVYRDPSHTTIIQNGSFSQMPNLTHLSIVGGGPIHISSRAFLGLGALKMLNLKILNVQRDQMHEYFSSWPNLPTQPPHPTKAELEHSPLISFDKGWLEPLTELTGLQIVSNRLGNFPIEQFCRLHYLEVLALRQTIWTDTGRLGIMCNNQQTHCPPCLPNLTTLAVSRVSTPTSMVNFKTNIPELKYLKMSNCSISTIKPDARSILTRNIEEIDLSHNILSSFALHEPGSLNASNLHVLNLKNNKLAYLSPGLFTCMKNLHIIDLKRNVLSVQTIINAGLGDLSRLTSMDLSYNNIPKLSYQMFRNMTYLREFSCIGCHLGNIEKGAFDNLRQLQYLSLNNNGLQSIEAHTFKDMANLQGLYLSINSIKTLSDTFSQSWPNLKSLDLARNDISEFIPDQVLGLRNLKWLSLAWNNITVLPQYGFNPIEMLEVLRLSSNRIQKIDQFTFNGLDHLIELDLDQNLIPNMPIMFMSSMKSLRHLNMSGNLVKHLKRMDFSVVEVLDLSWNQISKLQFDFMQVYKHLKFLNLTYNKLRHLSNEAFLVQATAPSHQLLDLPSVLLEGNILNCDCRTEWLMEVNQDKTYFQIYREKTGLALDLNNYRHATLDKYRYIKFPDLAQVYCNTSTLNDQKALSSVTTEDFLCPYKTECHCQCCKHSDCYCHGVCYESCECFHKLYHSNNFMNCTGRNLRSLSIEGPFYAQQILLDGNMFTNLTLSHMNFPHLKELRLNNSNISYVEPHAFHNFKLLRVLYLHDNAIEKVKMDMFINISNDLEILYLHNNKIRYIDSGSFDHMVSMKRLLLNRNNLSEIDLNIFDNLKSLTELALHDNPWDCNCHFGPLFQKWLIKNLKTLNILKIKDIYCMVKNLTNAASHINQDGTFVSIDIPQVKVGGQSTLGYILSRPLVDVDFSYCKNSKTIEYRDSVVGTMCSAAAFIMLGILVISVYSNRLLLKVWVYNKFGLRFRSGNEDDDNEERPYDVFIACTEADTEQVWTEYRRELEFGAKSYKLCLECRNFPVGEAQTLTRIAAIDQSKRTILLVTDHFFEDGSEWNQYEFQVANIKVLKDKQIRLIIVLANSNVKSRLPPDMALYLKTGVSLVHGEFMFWEKLRYLLSDNPRGAHGGLSDFEVMNIKRGQSI